MSNEHPTAIIATGGKQYRVKVGQKLQVEKLTGEQGNKITFGKDAVMLISDGDKTQVGAPFLDKAQVEAQIVRHGRGEKIKVFKMKRRKKYRRTQGHRQDFTEIEITNIKAA